MNPQSFARSPAALRLALMLGLSLVSFPLPAQTLPQQVAGFLLNAQPAGVFAAANAPSIEPARADFAPDGSLRYAGAPPGKHFPGVAAGLRGEAARLFLIQNGRVFGITSPNVDFAILKTRDRNGRLYVRLRQTCAGLRVFAAEVTVQMDGAGGIESVLSDIEHDLSAVDRGQLSLVPAVAAEEASTRARERPGRSPGPFEVQAAAPELVLFAPGVLGESGALRLAWLIEVSSGEIESNATVLVDAHTGEILRRYARYCEALNRQIFDAGNTTNRPGTLMRLEGQAASGAADVDAAYQFLGDAYEFYWTNHGRDSIDGAGMALSTTVRYCEPGYVCPWANAYYSFSDDRIYIGQGWAVDDVVAHELTHGVTQHESGLIYANTSGAINESFSDVWGEFVDLGNGAGNDNATNRWLFGEDLARGALRSMSHPTLFSDPDRVDSPLYQPFSNNPSKDNDFGGVHKNSGVNNKLCYLLTDGGTFNGQTVRGMGIPAVAFLYYEVNANLLTSGADWVDLYNALRQAAVNLGWSTADRNNLFLACVAVEIPSRAYVDGASLCIPVGVKDCNGLFAGPYNTVAQALTLSSGSGLLFLRAGNYNEGAVINNRLHLRPYDGPVTIGRP